MYEGYQWSPNGVFRARANWEGREFHVAKKPIYYLQKRHKPGHELGESSRNAPYISYEDLKKDLEDASVDKQKNEKFFLTEPGDNVFIAPSPIHKLGLFSKHAQPRKTTMVEYIG